MRRVLNFIICTTSEEKARKKILDWFAGASNLIIDKVEPYSEESYHIVFSYDEKER